MFCPHLNSYLQLSCAVNPRVINVSVAAARARLVGAEADPPTRLRRLSSSQPSLFAPCVDATRARLGLGRVGLRKLNRELHDRDPLVQLQALHAMLDRVMRPESAYFLIHLQLVYRLVDLMLHQNPVVREKVCLLLTRLANIHQGRRAIMSRKLIFTNLMALTTKDPKKEVRYAAAHTLETVARDRCAAEVISEVDNVVLDLLEAVKRDHVGIALLHLKTLENLIEWEPKAALECGAFDTLLELFRCRDERVASGALDCARQLLKRAETRRLADESDLAVVLHELLSHASAAVVASAAGAMQYATLTTRSKWRARERCAALASRLVALCSASNEPPLQLACMRTLINLCDLPDVRGYAKGNLLEKVEGLRFRTHEEWDGTTETTSYGLETGHNYRTLCVENVETILNEEGDARAVDVHSYLDTLHRARRQLVEAINWLPYP